MPTLKEYRMDNDFNMIGIWTNNYNNFDETISGTMYYSDDGIELQLLDVIGDNDKDPFDIYGFSQDGKLIWLKNCSLKTNNWSAPGFPIERYVSQECFIFEIEFNYFKDSDFISKAFNRILDNNKDFKVEKLTSSTNNLYEWFGGIIPEDNSKDFEYLFTEENWELKFGVLSTIKSGIETKNKKLEGEVILKKSDDQKMFFTEILERSKDITKILELFCQKTLHYNYIQFNILTIDKNINDIIFPNYPIIKGRYFINQIGQQNDQKLKNRKLKLRDLDEKFEQILNSWVNKKELLEFIINDYLSDLYLPYYIEPKLLNSIRNLEIYYRNFIEIEDENKVLDMDEEKDKIIDYIEENIENKYKNKFTSRVDYPDSTSLSNKLKNIVRNLPKRLFDYLDIKQEGKSPSDSISSFVHKLVQTRNYYTHGDKPEKYPNRIIDPSEFYSVNRKLRIIVTYYLYKELEINEETIIYTLTGD